MSIFYITNECTHIIRIFLTFFKCVRTKFYPAMKYTESEKDFLEKNHPLKFLIRTSASYINIFHKIFLHLPHTHWTRLFFMYSYTTWMKYEISLCIYALHSIFPFSWRLIHSITTLLSPYFILLYIVYFGWWEWKDKRELSIALPPPPLNEKTFSTRNYRSSIRFFLFCCIHTHKRIFVCGRILLSLQQQQKQPGHGSSLLISNQWEWKGQRITSHWCEWKGMLFALRNQLHLASTMRCIIEDRGFMYQR